MVVDGLPDGSTPLDRPGPATGAAGLIPAPPISVAPRGIPMRPIDEGEGSGDEILRLSAQESDEVPDIPPPSKAPDGPAPSELAQVPISSPCEGTTGPMPGVAISVEPSGMPPDRLASGDVVCVLADCVPGDVAWANVAVGSIHVTAAINAAVSTAETILHDLECFAWLALEERCLSICGAPAGLSGRTIESCGSTSIFSMHVLLSACTMGKGSYGERRKSVIDAARLAH